MDRRQFVKTSFSTTAALALANQGFSQPNQPNVLFIGVEDLNDWIGCLGGHPDTITPNFDRLANMGMLFSNAHCNAPACVPSRTTLLTGIRPSTSGVYDNGMHWQDYIPDAVTMPVHFRDHGYTTRKAGKIFHFEEPTFWDDMAPFSPKVIPPEKRYNGLPLKPNDRFDWTALDVPEEEMQDYKHADYVISTLENPPDQPYFLACGFHRVHTPWYYPRKYMEKFNPNEVTLPPYLENDLDDVSNIGISFTYPALFNQVKNYKQWHAGVAAYLAGINFIDAQLGRILDAFDATGAADNTIIVLWSDHGWHLGEKNHWKKFTLWEESTRIPMMIHVPWLTTENSSSDQPMSMVDLFPTLNDLCGLPDIDQLEGSSLVPWLSNPNLQRAEPALTTYRYMNHALRDDQWRFIRYNDGSEELYDHDTDPNEWTNLADIPAYQPIKDALSQWFPEVNHP